MTDSRFEGNLKLYKEDFNKLQNKHVLIIGAGGVGSWCAEFLVRSGIHKLTLVDLDDICVTNINRQVQALTSTVGQFKVETLKKRIQDINPDCEVNQICDFYTKDTTDEILNADYDFVIDAFDSAKNKALLASECADKNIPLILSGAAGGKKDLTLIDLKNFKRVENDKLIKTIRRDLKKYHPDFFKKDYFLPCVFSPEPTVIDEKYKGGGINCRGALGSTGMMTASFGLRMANYVLEYFINDSTH